MEGKFVEMESYSIWNPEVVNKVRLHERAYQFLVTFGDVTMIDGMIKCRFNNTIFMQEDVIGNKQKK